MAVSVKRINNATVDHAGAAAVEDKVRRLLAERTKLNEQWRANVAALKDAVAAGRLFGVEVTLPPDIGSPGNVHSYRPRLNEVSGNLFESAVSRASANASWHISRQPAMLAPKLPIFAVKSRSSWATNCTKRR